MNPEKESPPRSPAPSLEKAIVCLPSGATLGLLRRLGLFDMTMLVMGSVIGVGIFRTPHSVADAAQSPLLILGAWILGGCVALAGSLIYAEWTRRRPDVGGQYAYLREAYHPAVGFLYGWSLLWIIQSGGIASVAVVFSDYFIELLHAFGGWSWPPGDPVTLEGSKNASLGIDIAKAIVTTAAIGIFTLINCTGVRAAGTTQNIFMSLKILAISMLVICGLLFTSAQWNISWEFRAAANAGSEASGGPPGAHGWQIPAMLGAAMVPVFFSYGGWHTTTFVGEEVRDPRRTMSRALVLGVFGVMVLYVAVNFVCLRALGASELAHVEKPAAAVMEMVMGKPGAALISVGIAISAIGFLSQAILTSPRVYYAMAKDGLFFRSVAWVHPRTRVPVVAIVLQGLFAIVIALSGTFEQILNYVMSVEMVFWCLTAFGLLVIRRRDAAVPGSGDLSMPGYWPAAVLFVGVNLAVLIAMLYKYPLNCAIGIAIALAGVPVYLFWRGRG
jgi:APA family basic amino acid/polyamine antiporter